MIKQMLYPKTARLGVENIQITEKMDGSNLCIFKYEGILYIAQRNRIFTIKEAIKESTYKGLSEWLRNYKDVLKEGLVDNAVLCGEWMGMGYIKYEQYSTGFLMYAKANVKKVLDEEGDFVFKIENINYSHDLFIHCFEDKYIPAFIGEVPIVKEGAQFSDLEIENLNERYSLYKKEVDREVEGFVISVNNQLLKYVRFKRGKETTHSFS